VLRSHGYRDCDLLYLDFWNQRAWIKALRPKASVFRVTDLYQGFRNANRCMDREFRKTLEQATHVVYTAEAIGDELSRLGRPDGTFVGNGVDYEHFATEQSEPDEYAALPRPIVLFVGGLDTRLNMAWIRQAAAALPDASFVLIGPDHGAAGSTDPLPSNMHLLGPRPYSSIPAYMQHADVGIIPFDVSGCETLIKGTNPLKVYQYFAAGLPVVASRWPELERVGSPAQLCDSAEEFVAAVRGALRNAITSDAGRKFAAQHEWGLKIGAFMRTAQLA
jgi:glycosyltransferase involved in cell wall biosynthesis